MIINENKLKEDPKKSRDLIEKIFVNWLVVKLKTMLYLFSSDFGNHLIININLDSFKKILI